MTELLDAVQLTPEQQAAVNHGGEPARSTRFLMTHFPELSFDEAYAKSVQNYHRHREEWLQRWVDPFAAKHGLTRLQALSVLYCDNSEEPMRRDVMCPAGDGYAAHTLAAAGLRPYTPLGLQPLRKGERVRFARRYIESLGGNAGNLGSFEGTVAGRATTFCPDPAVSVHWDSGSTSDHKADFLERVS